MRRGHAGGCYRFPGFRYLRFLLPGLRDFPIFVPGLRDLSYFCPVFRDSKNPLRSPIFLSFATGIPMFSFFFYGIPIFDNFPFSDVLFPGTKRSLASLLRLTLHVCNQYREKSTSKPSFYLMDVVTQPNLFSSTEENDT